jgi:4-amino-4-deoxy-L-arabinose transferase-like glycosyltransferase
MINHQEANQISQKYNLIFFYGKGSKPGKMNPQDNGNGNSFMALMKRNSLSFILLMGFIVRLPGIFSRPIWYDEAFSILFSEKGLGPMLYGTLTSTGAGTADIHPLGYYSLLWVWMSVFGGSLLAVRLMSIIAGVATVGLAYLIAQELFSKRIAVLSGVIVALAPFQVHYSQEIRMYALLAFWLLLATYAIIRASLGAGGKKWWLIFAVYCALAQYTHNLAAFYLIPLALTPVYRKDWRSLLAVSLSGLGAILLYLPWLIFVPGQFAKISTAYWVVRPGFEKIFTLLLVYVTNLPLPDNLLFIGLFISLAVVCIAMIQTFKHTEQKSYTTWLLYLSFAPPVLLFLFSQWVPVYIERVLLPSGVIFCIWLAGSLYDTSLNKIIRNVLTVMLIFGAGIGLYQHISYQGFPYAPFRELDASLKENLEEGDVIIHSSKLSILPAVYFDRDLKQVFIADPPGSGVDTSPQPHSRYSAWYHTKISKPRLGTLTAFGSLSMTDQIRSFSMRVNKCSLTFPG